MNMTLVLDWIKQLGWKRNPFIEENVKYLIGHKKERHELNLFVLSDSDFGLIKGDLGVGKTSLLKWLEVELKQSKKIVPVYIELRRKMDFFNEFIEMFLGTMEKYVFKKQDKLNTSNFIDFLRDKVKDNKLVLLIDNAELTTERINEYVKSMLDSYLNVQVIAAAEGMSHPRDELKLHVSKMGYDDIREMIAMRIESVGGDDIRPFNDKFLKKVSADLNYNPKKILKICSNFAKVLSVKGSSLPEDDPEEPKEEISDKKESRSSSDYKPKVVEFEPAKPREVKEMESEEDKLMQNLMKKSKKKNKKK